ncbi:uncharacterized protein LOC126676544 [Mercurialis annua]|uniref:uncharacterized protein LOC126676544 n=1 Tax=Mercurialis annua TaxID=3986 RepID=UPI00215E889D|nr:uncharacterized protein LOC126676544 [Mercurialis annua]
MENITQESRNKKNPQENPNPKIQESRNKKNNQENPNPNIQESNKKNTHENPNPKIQESRNSKIHQEKPDLNLNLKQPNTNKKAIVWDCDSALYDSFELKSFERQLYSAIHSRTLSMPHLPDRRVAETAGPVAETKIAPLPPPAVSKKGSKISRSLNKFIKSVFKSKQNSSGFFRLKDRPGDEYFVVYDKSGALSTIPEAPEIDFSGFSPEINSLVRRTGGSERFSATSVIGISCA